MHYPNPRTRLRHLTCTLCMLIAVLVLLWGTAFKTSLYHSFRDLAHVPAAKLLTDHERPAPAQSIAAARADVPPAPQDVHHFSAIAIASPQLALAQHTALLSYSRLASLDEDPALGFYFHHPPPHI